MKLGQIKKSVLKRSVLDRLRGGKIDVGKILSISFSESIPYFIELALEEAISKAMLYSDNINLRIELLITSKALEVTLHSYVDRIIAILHDSNIYQIEGITVAINNALKEDMITVGIATSTNAETHIEQGLILITDNYLYSGAKSLYSRDEAFFKERYNKVFLEGICELDRKIKIAYNREDFIFPLGSLGLYGALEELKKYTSGYVLDLAALYIRQDIVEILEAYQANPFKLNSVGTSLIITDNPNNYDEAYLVGKIASNGYKLFKAGTYIDLEPVDEDELQKAIACGIDERSRDEKRNLEHDTREC